MDRRQIGLKLLLDHLGLPLKVESFDDRLILQKAVYLAQSAGVNLGYYFRWYLRGPYCPPVADDGITIAEELLQGGDESKGWTLDSASAQRAEEIRGLFAGSRSGLARKLELLASVHFLIDRKQVAGRTPEKIAALLQKCGKNFRADDVERALGELGKHGILS